MAATTLATSWARARRAVSKICILYTSPPGVETRLLFESETALSEPRGCLYTRPRAKHRARGPPRPRRPPPREPERRVPQHDRPLLRRLRRPHGPRGSSTARAGEPPVQYTLPFLRIRSRRRPRRPGRRPRQSGRATWIARSCRRSSSRKQRQTGRPSFPPRRVRVCIRRFFSVREGGEAEGDVRRCLCPAARGLMLAQPSR